ncbi:helix-turn-helix domain-containing protein [Vibrio methylphosphonaticus]|uniref:helix-turn-helix domain-containing protein n=1 Tax=Vibrio methylphosphonaticus TaxID=2946866 RepID=UPI00202A9F8D|nr:helix-turn-helix domain-containing protein [Vibrio methylphosphonaticus]MCL9775735.1 helix-turn-helix domain-containing protein [Vibrio methylphosphonaticus]
MTRIPAKVEPFEYLKGREFTDKLREVTECPQYNQLADYFGVPRSTILTWHRHDRTPFELIVREHLHSGASVKYLALGEGKPFPKETDDVAKGNGFVKHGLVNGQLLESGQVEIGHATLADFGLEKSALIVVEQDGSNHFISTSETHPTAGSYLIDIDGSLSINHLQRLPGKKLAIAFGESTVEVAEEDIKVIGRVAMEMKKK